VTPEFVDGMEPHEVPQCGPGMESVSPTNCQLYWGGHLEVPASGPCGPNNCGAASSGGYNTGCSTCDAGVSVSGAAYISDGGVSSVPSPVPMGPMQVGPVQVQPQPPYINSNGIDTGAEPIDVPTPSLEPTPQAPPALDPGPAGASVTEEPTAYRTSAPWMLNQRQNALQAPLSPSNPYAPATAQRPRGTSTPGLMGPIGYDVE